MSRLSLPYVVPVRVTVDLDARSVDRVDVDAAEARPDPAGGVYDEDGLVAGGDVRVLEGFVLAGALPWPGWTVEDRER